MAANELKNLPAEMQTHHLSFSDINLQTTGVAVAICPPIPVTAFRTPNGRLLPSAMTAKVDTGFQHGATLAVSGDGGRKPVD